MLSNMLVSCHLVVWRVAQFQQKLSTSFNYAGATKIDPALAACCIHVLCTTSKKGWEAMHKLNT